MISELRSNTLVPRYVTQDIKSAYDMIDEELKGSDVCTMFIRVFVFAVCIGLIFLN